MVSFYTSIEPEEAIIIRSCCVTGHREFPVEQLEYVRERLYDEIKNAIKNGYTQFISGFASGTDLLFAELIIEFQNEYPNIKLKAAIPFRKRLESKDVLFQRLLKLCDNVQVY